MKLDKKILIGGGVVLLVLILLVGRVLLAGKSTTNTNQTNAIPTEELIPTVDSSVKVDLASKVSGKEVTLSVKNIPNGTTSIEYSLSYQTVKQGIQGVIGTVTTTSSEKDYSKDLTLGTCSSGTCVYHDVQGPINVSLKFNGSFGERVFGKDFTL